jgi:hypothetical protein
MNGMYDSNDFEVYFLKSGTEMLNGMMKKLCYWQSKVRSVLNILLNVCVI